MKRVILIFLIFLILPVTFAATLKGKIYNLDLEIVDETIIEINSSPIQKILTNGSYSLEVPEGDYLLIAYSKDLYLEEQISIKNNGTYQTDLFLFPDIRDEEELFNEPFSVDQIYETNNAKYWWFLTLLILIIPLFFRKKKTEQDPLEEKIYSIIKKEKKITQKELRKLIPFSEAKVSLILTDLENKKKIRKIKKGRSNVITLI